MLFNNETINDDNYKGFIDDYITILSYRDMLYNNDYPKLTSKDKDKIELIIFSNNYDKLLKPLVYKLYKHTSVNNLLYCALNLPTVKLTKIKLQGKDSKARILYNMIDGTYDRINNNIHYKRNSDISHELLHLSSTKPSKHTAGGKSGFSLVRGNAEHYRGINEGYTEMLNRRIFFSENYNTGSYKKKVYFMRLLELLCDDPKEMENAYFRADNNWLKDFLLNYITNDELEELLITFDKYDFLVVDEEEKRTFKTLQKIITRINSKEKNEIAKDYINEYYKKPSSH